MEQSSIKSELEKRKRLSNVMTAVFMVVVTIVNFFICLMLPLIFANNNSAELKGAVFFLSWVILFGKLIFIDKNIISNLKGYYIGKFVDVGLIALIIFSGDIGFIAASLLYLVLVLSSSLTDDLEAVQISTFLGCLSYISFIVSVYVKTWGAISIYELVTLSIMYLINAFICGAAGYGLMRYMLGKDRLVLEADEKIDKLAQANKELTNVSAQVKFKLNELQNSNDKTFRSLAELSTIQEISQVINSTLDIKELLNLVNDIIIGLLGVPYCTIFLREEDTKNLSMQGSNIKNEDYIKGLWERVGLKVINLIETGHTVLNSNVDPYDYPFALERGIKSAMFVPIINKGKVRGLILAEHTIEKGLNEQARKFMETVASQVGLAIENAMLYEQMEKTATTDALTKVYNRLYFQTNFTIEFKQANKEQYPISVAMMDIDHFKNFNDSYGHDYGDVVLKTIGQMAEKIVGDEGFVSRFGGEEFIILFRNMNLGKAYTICEEIRKQIEEHIFEFNKKGVKATVSIGVSEAPSSASTEQELVRTADNALYKAKDDGRNCVRKAPIIDETYTKKASYVG